MKPMIGVLRGRLFARSDPTAGLGDLEASLHEEGCPVCKRAARADEHWLDYLLAEGYQERRAVEAIAHGGGLCAWHARRLDAIGPSAPIALIHLDLIDRALPALARRERGKRPRSLVPEPDFCAACREAAEAERRGCFFLSLLINAHGLDIYGCPALVCGPHLLDLASYLSAQAIEGVLERQHRQIGDLRAQLAGGEPVAERAIALLLGPADMRSRQSPQGDGAFGAADADPVRRLRRRLRWQEGCSICAEIADAGAQWLRWLPDAAEGLGDLSDVVPRCRHHAWQATVAGSPALAASIAAALLAESDNILAHAVAGSRQYCGFPRLPAPLRRALSEPARKRAALRPFALIRECPLCRRAREARERAIALLGALLEGAAARRSFEDGYGLCVRHAAHALRQLASGPPRDTIAATMRSRLAVLRWELEEQLRRVAWQARPEGHGGEADAWLRATARFSGTVGPDGP
jgi:hypothetical protein